MELALLLILWGVFWIGSGLLWNRDKERGRRVGDATFGVAWIVVGVAQLRNVLDSLPVQLLIGALVVAALLAYALRGLTVTKTE